MWALKELVARGKPMAALTLVKQNPPWSSDMRIAQIRQVSPKTKIVHRIERHDEGSFLNWSDPNAGTKYARHYFDNFLTGTYAEGYDMKGADWVQPINEPGEFNPVVVARFWNQVLNIAEPLGIKLACFGFSERNPNDYSFWQHPDIDRLLTRIKTGGHAVMLHRYVIDPKADPNAAQGHCIGWDYSDFQKDHLYRFEQDLLHMAPVHRDIPMLIAEFGDIQLTKCGADFLKRNVVVAEQVLKRWPNVAAMVWTMDTGGSNLPTPNGWLEDDIRQWTPQYVDAVMGR